MRNPDFRYIIGMGLLGVQETTRFDHALEIIHRETGARRLHYHSKSHFPEWEDINGQDTIKIWESKLHGEMEPTLATITRIPFAAEA